MAYSERDRNLETQLRSLELPVVTRTDKKEPKGTGSYANVYEVMVHETVCAAKEMHPILISETKKSAFLAECVQCSRILHPNVVQFLGIYYPSPDAQLPWLVMEMMYISLTGLIEKYETEDFPFHVKLSILVDACQGIQYLHSRDIIHRDLSSNNILLTMYLVAKIGDLGMAKVVSRDLDKHTQAPGTVAFMPPEALSVNPVYGPSIDVFSLGCVCVHMVSLQWPIPSDQVTADDVVVSEIQRREAYLINLTKFPGLTQLVERCLQNKSEKRPAIGDVIKDLKNVEYDRHPHKYDSIIELFKGVKNLENVLNQKDQQLMAKDNQLILKDQQLSQKNEQIYQKDQQLKQKDEELALIVSQKDQKLQQKGQEMVQIVSLKDQKLDQKDEQLRQKDQEISAKDVQISKKKQQLRHKEQEMAEILNQKEQILNQKDQQISEKDKQLKENDQQLMRMEQEIAQKDEQLSQKDQQLRQQDQEMAQMVSQMDQKLHQKDQLQQEMTHDQQLCLQLTQKNQKLAQDVSNQADQILDSKDQLRGRSQKMARNELELESSRKTQESVSLENTCTHVTSYSMMSDFAQTKFDRILENYPYGCI